MASYRCTQCGQSRSETPFCHGPMECVEEVEIARLRTVISAYANIETAYQMHVLPQGSSVTVVREYWAKVRGDE